MSSNLPHDIIITIIDELSEDTTTIKACSLISSSFREFCQKYLYRSIKIELQPFYRFRNEQLHKILTCNPHIGTFVRRLVVSLVGVSDVDTWSGILGMLPSVTTLDIEGHVNLGPSWNSLAGGLKVDLVSLLKQSSLESVCFRDIYDFPISYFTRCSQLKEIKLPTYAAMKFEDFIIPPPPSLGSANKGHLESLYVVHPGICHGLVRLLTHPSSYLTLSRLRSYESSIGCDSDNATFQVTLDAAASSLEEVQVNLRSGPVDVNCLNLRRLSSLKRFKVTLWGSRAGIRWICNVLGTVSQHNSIVEIILNRQGLLRRPVEGEEWERIDTVLRTWKADALRRVVLTLSMVQSRHQISDFCARWMPHLVSKGRLFVYHNSDLIYPVDLVPPYDAALRLD